jgi:hypothetical protein
MNSSCLLSTYEIPKGSVRAQNNINKGLFVIELKFKKLK